MKRKAEDSAAGIKKKRKSQAGPIVNGGELEESMLVEWLKQTPNASTRDCIHHFTPYLTNEEKKQGFTKMVKEVMLSKEERQWLKVRLVPSSVGRRLAVLTGERVQDHNRRCLELLEPFVRTDKRAMRWLRREAERGIGIAGAGPGGLTIDWD